MEIKDKNKHIEYLESSIIPKFQSGYLSIAAQNLENYLDNNHDLIVFLSEKTRISEHMLVHQKEEHIKEDTFRVLNALKTI